MEYVLQTHELTKKYGSQTVLDKVNINIGRGDIYGFVGENGSGKTTVIRLISGLIFENSGSLELFGTSNKDPRISKARRKLGAIVESPSIYHNMSAYDNLKLQGELIGGVTDETIKETLSEVGLGHLFTDKKAAGNFSLGMRQRLGIAMALLGEPELLLLDEPMNGLDPAGIVEIRELILKLNRERGITFLISSHILTELSLVATKYGIISKGKIVREISAEELRRECRRTTAIHTSDRDALLALLPTLLPEEDIAPTADGARIYGETRLNSLFSAIIDAGIEITSVNCTEASIEDFYLKTVGGRANA
ncbi:MAG: ATP-binding cassette domain-containing protein [Clostridia bacterium]|nr:ATP-binding cassette domain-containing protein [Clostridia bacterium]